jgi:sugar phosphate isomerase/epimerase
MAVNFKIGVMVESFRLGLSEGLKAAAKVGANGIQLYVTGGETHFSKLTGAALADLKKQLSDLGLEVSALCADFGGHGFQVEAENPERIENSKRVIDLARQLDSRVVTTHIGVVPAQKSHPRYKIMAKACEELGRYGEKMGACFAIETGPEPAAVLKSFLDDIGVPNGMGVNFDPANLVMVCRENIPAAVVALAPYIRHTHAKDGVNLKVGDPEVIYGAVPAPEGFNWADYFKEVPLGEGQVNFDTYLAELSKVDFGGYLTIEREVGDNPSHDIEMAVKFLKQKITAVSK